MVESVSRRLWSHAQARMPFISSLFAEVNPYCDSYLASEVPCHRYHSARATREGPLVGEILPHVDFDTRGSIIALSNKGERQSDWGGGFVLLPYGLLIPLGGQSGIFLRR